MATSSRVAVGFAILAVLISLWQPQLAISQPDFLSPLLSPIIGDICKSVGCGKGKCKISKNNDLQYECECDPGWKQTLLSNSSSYLKFLPCVIPNCTISTSCSEAAPSPQPHQRRSNASIFEPCQWANCGGGICNKSSELSYECQCKEGYNNLFNSTGFPCFKECSIGGDCAHLGLPMSNKSMTPPASSLNESGSNQGHSTLFSRYPQMRGGIIMHPRYIQKGSNLINHFLHSKYFCYSDKLLYGSNIILKYVDPT